MSLGVTISTEAWLVLAKEALRRWEKFTGLPGKIIVVGESDFHMAKMSLREPCWCFDADLWLVRQVTLPPLRDDCLYATPVCPAPDDMERIRTWAAEDRIDVNCYFATGLYGSDWSAGKAMSALTIAREHSRQHQIYERDERQINVGAQRAGMVVGMLPSTLNWHPHCGESGYGYAPEGGPIGIHAGGIPELEKLHFLREHTAPC